MARVHPDVRVSRGSEILASFLSTPATGMVHQRLSPLQALSRVGSEYSDSS